MGCMDSRVVYDVAAARVQLRDRAGGVQPASAVGPETPGRPGLGVRMTPASATIAGRAATPPAPPATWSLPEKGRVGMACLILTESSFFAIFVVAYLFYIGKSLNGPFPSDVLELPILNTICLLSSSVTIVFALRALREGKVSGFS